MAVTPYLRLQKPPFDSIPWDQAINGNMDILDSTIAQYLSIPNFGGSWSNATNYTVGQVILDATAATLWQCNVSHASAVAPTTFAQDRSVNPTYWTNVTTAPAVQGNVGRNLLHNPLFNVKQRGVGGFAVAAGSTVYTGDRWLASTQGCTGTVNIYPIGDAVRAAFGDEAAEWQINNAVTGTSGVGDTYQFSQRIEDVRRLGGKIVTASFWASSATGTYNLGVTIGQVYGTGGSPSVAAFAPTQTVYVTPAWTHYTLTFSVPSNSGKTLGTNNNDYTQLSFILSQQGTAVGVQSWTLALWGMQLEIGSVATPLERPDPQQDIAKCQRMCCFLSLGLNPGVVTAGSGYNVPFPVAMRATPIATNRTAGTISNAAVLQEAAADTVAAFFQISTSAANGYVAARYTLYSADL